MTATRLLPFIPSAIDAVGAGKPIAKGVMMPADDLFGRSEDLARGLADDPDAMMQAPGAVEGDHAAFVLPQGIVVSVDLRTVRPAHVQCLLALVGRARARGGDRAQFRHHVVDAECGLGLWTNDEAVAGLVRATWPTIRSAGDVGRATALTTPWIYGNKLRLTGFIAPVAAVSLQPGAPVLDLMSGTGVVARALSNRHPVAVNDANPYAALLSRTQGVDPTGLDLPAIATSLQAAFAENNDRLQTLVGGLLQEEAAILHGDGDEAAMARFAALAESKALPITGGDGAPARLATERYANVYFGVAQCVEIDSLRWAIERTFPDPGVERDLCLAALLVACANGTSGPHFAQPARPKSPRSLRTILELRARSIAWEFELALGRLVARGAPRHTFLSSTCVGWREALSAFADRQSGGPAAVYVDPPYSKLQYSRYYHVLNVLLAYDYPAVAGTGRYPPLEQRFSSRFEYQPGMARRELSELIRTCAERGLTTMLSYAEGGFVGMDRLTAEMGAAFASVEAFSEPLRHHSQGRALPARRGLVLEHLLVGHPGSVTRATTGPD